MSRAKAFEQKYSNGVSDYGRETPFATGANHSYTPINTLNQARTVIISNTEIREAFEQANPNAPYIPNVGHYVVDLINRYHRDTVVPWLDEQNITKFRSLLVYTNREETATEHNMLPVSTYSGSFWISNAIIFKKAKDTMLCKLVFG